MFMWSTRSLRKRTAITISAILVVAVVAIQFLPHGRLVSNPPVRVEPRWYSPETRELAARACFDCHSNETRYPWYSAVAPVSWLVRNHVADARRRLNFSEWDLPQREANDAANEVRKGDMPLKSYVWLHPTARLSPEETQLLIQGLRETVANDRPARR